MSRGGVSAVRIAAAVLGAAITQPTLIALCADPWVALLGAILVGTVCGVGAGALLARAQARRVANRAKSA